MKIEDAIKRYESWAEDDRIDVLIRNEHRQIADWLKELNADKPSGYIHIDDVYRLIAGHSDYHGDSILSAFTCLTEGKEVKPIKPLDRPQQGEWIMEYWCHGHNDGIDLICPKCEKSLGTMRYGIEWYKYCPFCGRRMKG